MLRDSCVVYTKVYREILKGIDSQYPLFTGLVYKIHKGLVLFSLLSDLSITRYKDNGVLTDPATVSM